MMQKLDNLALLDCMASQRPEQRTLRDRSASPGVFVAAIGLIADNKE
jgi:hypothetical protein